MIRLEVKSMICYGYIMKYHCPLCKSILTYSSYEFARCLVCDAYVRNPMTYLNHSDEHERYKLHENTLDNQPYLNFLTPLSQLVKEHVSEGSLGLDFGCGPVFAMEKLLKDTVSLNHYDAFFYPNEDVLNEPYDFIILSEVIEHFHHPAKELKRLRSLLKPQGLLFIQTHRHDDIPSVNNWYYAKDPTHVFLCSLKTCQCIADMFDFKMKVVTSRCVILQAN
jgi:SAM-dependent methyltransferase